MATYTSYMGKSKESLARIASRAKGEADKAEEERGTAMATLSRTVAATVTGPASAALTGYIETRFPNKDGNRMSLGPVPLPVVIGTTALAGSFFIWGNQLSHIAAANYGLAAGTLGRGYGVIGLAKSKKKAGSGGVGESHTYDEGSAGWSDEEREVLGL